MRTLAGHAVALGCAISLGLALAGCTPDQPPVPTPPPTQTSHSLAPPVTSPVPSPTGTATEPTPTVSPGIGDEQAALAAVDAFIETSSLVAQDMTASTDLSPERFADVAATPAARQVGQLLGGLKLFGWHLEGMPSFETSQVTRLENQTFTVTGCFGLGDASLADAAGRNHGDLGITHVPTTFTVQGSDTGDYVVFEYEAREGDC